MTVTPVPPGCPDRVELEKLAGGQPVHSAIAEHAHSCPECSKVLLEIRAREVFLRDFVQMGGGHAAGADALGGLQTESIGVPGAAAQPSEVRGQFIGPYKLLELIGEGGFGSVFMAEQERPMRRRVDLPPFSVPVSMRVGARG